MRRVVRVMAVASILAALLIPLPTFAQSGGPYTAGFQLQNLSSSTANVTITYYNQDGTTAASPSDTIAASSSKTYFPLSSVQSGFNGSVVVSSDQPLAAIANVLTSDFLGGASYSGQTAGATTVNLPLIMKANAGYSTWFNIQNAGTSSATVTVNYAPGACSESQTVAPGAAKTFDQSGNSCLPAGFVGAATVTSSQPMVGAVMQILAGSKSLLAYEGFTSASTNPVMPLVSTGYFGSITGIQIQNTGGASTSVTVSYTPSAGFPGAACQETKSVGAGASATFFLPLPGGCGTADAGSGTVNGFVGSAKVTGNTANAPLVAIVNQINGSSKSASAYDGINPASATANVSLPLIMDRNSGYFTGISVANVGTQPTNISCTFTGTSFTASASNVQPGASLTNVQLNQIANGYVGSANCTASGGDQKIAGIVNELQSGAAATSDALLTYDGANY